MGKWEHLKSAQHYDKFFQPASQPGALPLVDIGQNLQGFQNLEGL